MSVNTRIASIVILLACYSAAIAKTYQEGRAIVAQKPTACPATDRGRTQTAQVQGKSHDACTQAKNDAKGLLRNAVTNASCVITSTARCKVVNR